MNRILSSFVFLFVFFTAFAQHADGPSRSFLNPAYEPFYHGVASGDPLPDRIILWTRITTQNASETVGWEISTDVSFSTIVNSGSVTTDATKDFTVKVDATGLQPNTWYYYRFSGQGKHSLVGRTKTAPVSGVENLRFAVVSCSQLPNGYFHAYRDIINKNEVDAVLHLGDYLYEYKDDSSIPGDTTRRTEPYAEIITLADYRMRHSQYKLDADLREVHRQFPFVTVWDSHETANDTWSGGAGNHTEGAEGTWQNRKTYSRKAYFEWMPIRETAPGNDTIIHRTLHYGNLADLIMIDTRVEGRDEQIPGQLISLTNPTLQDTTRTILGVSQRNWLNNQLNTSTAKWKIIGNQVMVAPLIVFGSSIANPDQWDGYPHDRQVVFDNILNNNVNNVVFLTGDIHTSWSNDLPYDRSTYNSSTGAGSVAVEFIATSVTSGSGSFPVSSSVVQNMNPHIKYVDFVKRGYLLLDLNQNRTQGDHIYVSDITLPEFTSQVGASWYTNENERFLRQASGAIPARTGMPALAPETATGIGTVKNNLVSLMCYPNPFVNTIQVQYYLYKAESVTAILFDLNGKKVFEQTLNGNSIGLHEDVLQINGVNSGNYVLHLKSQSGNAAVSLIKL